MKPLKKGVTNGLKILLLLSFLALFIPHFSKAAEEPLPTNKTYQEIFPDYYFREAILETLNHSGKAVTSKSIVTPAELAQVTEIQIEDKRLASIEGVQYLTGLQYLIIHRTDLSDISPLSKFTPKNTFIDLDENKIFDVKALKPHANLFTQGASRLILQDQYAEQTISIPTGNTSYDFKLPEGFTQAAMTVSGSTPSQIGRVVPSDPTTYRIDLSSQPAKVTFWLVSGYPDDQSTTVKYTGTVTLNFQYSQTWAPAADSGMTYRTKTKLNADQFLKDVHAEDIFGLVREVNFSQVDVNTPGEYPVTIEYKRPVIKTLVHSLKRHIKIVEPITLTGWDGRLSPGHWDLSTHLERYDLFADSYHQKLIVLDAVTAKLDPGSPDPYIHTYALDKDFFKFIQYRDNTIVMSTTLKGGSQTAASLPSIANWEYRLGDEYEIHSLEKERITQAPVATMKNKPPIATAGNMIGPSLLLDNNKSEGCLRIKFDNEGLVYVDNITPTLQIQHNDLQLEYKDSVPFERLKELIGLTCKDNMDRVLNSGDSVKLTTDYDPNLTNNKNGQATIRITAADAQGNQTSQTVQLQTKVTLPTADAASKSYPLGTDSQDIRSEDQVTNLHSEVPFVHSVTAKSFPATHPVNTSLIGTTATTVTIQDDRGIEAEIPTSIQIEYANSLAFKADPLNGADRTGAALTLHEKNNKPFITVTPADNDGTQPFSSQNGDKTYLSYKFYHPTEHQVIDNSKKFAEFAVQNKQSTKDLQTAFQTSKLPTELTYGDIVEIHYNRDTPVDRYTNSVKATDEHKATEPLYYRVTADGFKRLTQDEAIGVLKFDPDRTTADIDFKDTPVASGTKLIQRKTDNFAIGITDTRYTKGWKLKAALINPFTNASGDQLLSSRLIFKDKNAQKVLSDQNVEIASLATTNDPAASSTILQYDKENGPLVQSNTSMLKAGTYTATIQWTLETAP
ncbi:hypothetical protein [Listeria costaricensis]|uniref:hypothetical protein n=1 Tax=Listeria costaricensis TaxID=2026604 RepID=UPI000C070A5A|nr:hypothetical protein [Listeria costaricensis]